MDHNKIIRAVAKQALSPLGLRRDGKSRVWYDDHGWWAIVVEFQPSSWGRGSYLNVGLSWMLYEQSHWAFDIGYREEGFQPAMREQQFEEAMEQIAAQASRSVERYREEFSSLSKMYAHYRGLAQRRGWPDYYAGVLAGLLGDLDAAEQHFRAVIDEPCTAAWLHGRRLRCVDLLRVLHEPEHFRDSVLGIVMRCRSARCLQEIPIQEIGLP